ncbi:MauE/DoxX family redox-associated membrane protein [Nocardioides terrigena]|uniref:MauE/DoxX family redox-associated membrane protein n=1 Tax=Nocardioides terrigena TaxID=424797 RepID=UPI001F158F44|nr:MauE/DoxX family redox-associated membrane protein [Nocardioides terrigena]
MKDWIGLAARLVTGGVWIVAGMLKLPDPAESVRAVRAYDLLPESIVPTVGYALPILEVVVGLCLVLGLLTRAMAVVSVVLFVAFIIGIASAWARGLEIDCGCFGGGGQLDGASAKYPGEIARDVGLLLASLWLVVRPRTRWSLDSLISPTRSGDLTDTDTLERDIDVEAQQGR